MPSNATVGTPVVFISQTTDHGQIGFGGTVMAILTIACGVGFAIAGWIYFQRYEVEKEARRRRCAPMTPDARGGKRGRGKADELRMDDI